LLEQKLRDRIPDTRVFMDLNSIEVGADFADVIRTAIESCAVLVALIGRRWLADEKGHRRLDDPNDFVRLEVQTALEHGVQVIPVLVDGAELPQRKQLPSGLQRLVRLHALELSFGRYQYDADRLLDHIQRGLAAASGPARRAAQLLASAERVTQSMKNGYYKTSALASIAEARAVTDPGRAELIAQSISFEDLRASTLARVARAVAATDLSRAARLFADAERIAQSITPKDWKARTLASIVKALAAPNPGV
jgi:hypothetical protein